MPTSSRPRGRAASKPTTPVQRTGARPGVAVLGAAVIGALAVGAVLLVRGSGDNPGQGATEMEHIHGIGVDPGDGTLYAGTHYGLFRISEEGTATLVAGRVQDFMGFTVAGPGEFLASGHPGEGQGGPGALGLIESTDRGESWMSLSLEGQADFHALEYRHGRVYGLNSMTGQLLVSQDKESWEVLSDRPIADFAVSPDDPDTIVATTQQGLARSTDGGDSFALVEGAPLVLLVSWAEDGTLAAVTPDGTVHTSRDAGANWTVRGSLGGPPEALTVESGSAIYAAANGEILASRDGGATFTTLHPR